MGIEFPSKVDAKANKGRFLLTEHPGQRQLSSPYCEKEKVVKTMAKCEVTGKKRTTGNNVSFAHNKTRRVFGANIQKIQVMREDGTVERMAISTKALKKSTLLKPAPRRVILEELKKAQ